MRGAVEGWLRDLSSDDYEVRERARNALLLHGGRARDLLEARRDDPDPEVRRAVRTVLERLAPAEAPPPPPGPGVDVRRLGLVTLDARGTLGEILALLARAHDATFDLPPDLRDRPAEAHVDGEPFFRQLDLLAAAAGLDAGAPLDASGRLALEETAPGATAPPTAYAGPFRARVVRVTTVRTLGAAPTCTHSLGIQVQWTPAVQVVSLRTPALGVAEDEGGRPLGLPAGGGGVVTYGLGAVSTSTEIAFSLQPEGAVAGERLARLEVAVPVRLRYDRRRVTFRDLAALPASVALSPAMAGGGRPGGVTLLRADPPDAPGGMWAVEVSARLEGETPRGSLRAYLEAPDGSLAALAVSALMTSADGAVSLAGRARLHSGERPAGVQVAWFLSEGEGEIPLAWAGIPLR